MSLKIISTFGDHSSLYPLAVKDVVNSLGMTAYSYQEGGKDVESKKIDAKDRFIDEFGTEAIWLGGLPFFKWLADKTIYKAKKLNPDVDIRLVGNKDQFEVAQKYAKEFSKQLNKPSILTSLTDAQKNSKLFKGLFIGKFAAATALTLASYFTLTVMKQKYTDKQVEKRELKRLAQEEQYKKHFSQNPTFKAFSLDSADAAALNASKSKGKDPSFKGIPQLLQSFMFNPVHNMFIVDAGITSERLSLARNKHEKMEYAIKEGSLLFFMYVAGKYVQQGIEYISDKLFKKPIKLHVEFLASDSFKNALENNEIDKHLGVFNKVVEEAKSAKNNKPIYEFIYNEANKENLVVKAAKKSGIVKVLDESGSNPNMLQKFINIFKINAKPEYGKVDPHQFINADDIKDLAKNIKDFAKAQKTAEAQNAKNTVQNFLNKAKYYKVGSVVANIGISCLFLGVIVPYFMKKYKEKYYGEGSHIQESARQRIQMNFKGNVG